MQIAKSDCSYDLSDCYFLSGFDRVDYGGIVMSTRSTIYYKLKFFSLRNWMEYTELTITRKW